MGQRALQPDRDLQAPPDQPGGVPEGCPGPDRDHAPEPDREPDAQMLATAPAGTPAARAVLAILNTRLPQGILYPRIVVTGPWGVVDA